MPLANLFTPKFWKSSIIVWNVEESTSCCVSGINPDFDENLRINDSYTEQFPFLLWKKYGDCFAQTAIESNNDNGKWKIFVIYPPTWLSLFFLIIQAQRRSSKVERYLKHRRAERPNPQVRSKGCSRRAEMPLNRWNTADDADLDVDEIVARDTCTGCAEISRVDAASKRVENIMRFKIMVYSWWKIVRIVSKIFHIDTEETIKRRLRDRFIKIILF